MIGSARRRMRSEVVQTARELSRLQLVNGTTGNVSARNGDWMTITPSRVGYAAMRARDVIDLDLRNPHPERAGRASRELDVHLELYQRRPDVRAIVHTHSPYAVAWGLSGRELPPLLEDARYYGFGAVPVVPYAASGSPELVSAVIQALGTGAAVLLERHGVLTVAGDLDTALRIAGAVEHIARVASIAGTV